MEILGIETIHRKYPENKWEFRAISVRISENGKLKDFIYGTGTDKGRKFSGVEIYSGPNYIVGSSGLSHSNRYEVSKVPAKYRQIVNMAKKIHARTKWSTEKYVNKN